ncbi:demethoxyubiquinone hydroxylase family protein [Clostridium botulinum]|uniref:demethoxyubiquinone hydroxylase family protein n=1 Tax=Clostridium botulinum TaxID=1491 RepID=UPI00174C5417|nr:demethoxyubiquinone hydroxylase family protein [Clostridium botulinum]MBD5637099.1 demethoxyubiquinone hydroxylase family protein [Clostridium botulinum]
MANLTQKEQLLLQDQKSHEELCIKKYTNYANQSNDPQLKQIFLNNAQEEQEHLNSINQLLSGQIPNVNSQQNNQQQQNSQMQPGTGTGLESKNDADLCTDLLATEKYVSSTYDTAIFEFRDPNIRNVLNHIQKEEQQHGEAIYKYMESKGMYNPQ